MESESHNSFFFWKHKELPWFPSPPSLLVLCNQCDGKRRPEEENDAPSREGVVSHVEKEVTPAQGSRKRLASLCEKSVFTGLGEWWDSVRSEGKEGSRSMVRGRGKLRGIHRARMGIIVAGLQVLHVAGFRPNLGSKAALPRIPQ